MKGAAAAQCWGLFLVEVEEKEGGGGYANRRASSFSHSSLDLNGNDLRRAYCSIFPHTGGRKYQKSGKKVF